MSVPESRSGRCSRASLQRIPRSVFLNACTRVPFVRISVCTEMRHGCRVKRRLQLRAATATPALNIFFQHVWSTKDITPGLPRKYIPSIVPAFLITAPNVSQPSDFIDISLTMHVQKRFPRNPDRKKKFP